MKRLKEFFKEHMLWVGLVAVTIPLAVHLWLQYESLSTLQATMPHARRAYMRKYLSLVIDKVILKYESKTDETLSLPAKAFNHTYPNPNYSPLKAIDLSMVYDHFTSHQFNGARLLFAGVISGPKDPTYVTVRFFDPVSCSFNYRPKMEEAGAAHSASANWMAMIMVKSNPAPKSVKLTVDERDPRFRIIVKPIVNQYGSVVGVAGMFLKDDVMIREYLAPAIKSSLAASFPDEYSDVIVTLMNNDDKLLYSNQKFEGKAYEVGWPLPFVFTDWFLGIRMQKMTEEQWSRRYFLTNLSFSLFTSMVLIGGIVLALRTASRSMKLSQMKADFVSNVSHELRTPLASIRVFGEFLKLGRVRDPNKIHEYGEYIETESRRLTQLINNILDFSKIESGQKTYQFEETDIEQVVTDTLKTFEVMLEQNGFKIDLEKPAAPLPGVVIDSNAIAQAFINLLDNAVKYSGEARMINVKLSCHDGFVTIAVRDHGIGIAKEEIDKIFEKFYRVGNSLVHDVKGSGLGLSIVKHVIEAHDGKVTIESEPGKGTTFSIHLPYCDTQSTKSHPGFKDHGKSMLGRDLPVSENS